MQGQRRPLPLVYLQGKNIRYVPIPDVIDPMATIRAHVCGERENGKLCEGVNSIGSGALALRFGLSQVRCSSGAGKCPVCAPNGSRKRNRSGGLGFMLGLYR